MATLTTSYQKIGTSGTVSFGGARAYLELYAKYNSQSTSDNNTNWSIEARLVVNNGYIGEYTGASLSLSGNGISSSQGLGTGNFTSRTLGSAGGTTGHNADGTKSVSASATVSFSAWGKSISVSASATLPTIPRYVDITEYEFTGKTETTATFKWNTSRASDAIQYSINNGSWTGGSWPTTTITGLSAGTTYNVKIRCKARDSQLWTESGNKSITTYNYPYCTSSPNFVIGNSLRLDFYNPLSRSITVTGKGADNSTIFAGTTTGTFLTGFNDSGSVNSQYASIPNSKSGTYKVSVTYGSSTKTRNSGNTYSIRGTETPTFNNFAYEDEDNTVQSLVGNNQILVNGNSDCKFIISLANKATGNNSASISKYIVQWGNKSSEVAYSSSQEVTQYVCDSTGGTLKVTAVDSRGLTTTVTKNITYIPYISAVITNLETQRKDGVDSKTYLKGKITLYSGSWNASSDDNSMNRLKYIGYSVYINNAWSEYYDITSEVLTKATVSTSGNNKIYEFDFGDEIELHANGSSGGFTVGTEYQIKFLIKDGNSSVVFTPYSYQALYEVRVTDGTVAMCLHKDSNGIYHIGLNGMSDDNWLISIGGTGVIRQKP